MIFQVNDTLENTNGVTSIVEEIGADADGQFCVVSSSLDRESRKKIYDLENYTKVSEVVGMDGRYRKFSLSQEEVSQQVEDTQEWHGGNFDGFLDLVKSKDWPKVKINIEEFKKSVSENDFNHNLNPLSIYKDLFQELGKDNALSLVKEYEGEVWKIHKDSDFLGGIYDVDHNPNGTGEPFNMEPINNGRGDPSMLAPVMRPSSFVKALREIRAFLKKKSSIEDKVDSFLSEISDETGMEDLGDGYFLKYEGWSSICFSFEEGLDSEEDCYAYAEEQTPLIIEEWKKEMKNVSFVDGGYHAGGLYGVTWALFKTKKKHSEIEKTIDMEVDNSPSGIGHGSFAPCDMIDMNPMNKLKKRRPDKIPGSGESVDRQLFIDKLITSPEVKNVPVIKMQDIV